MSKKTYARESRCARLREYTIMGANIAVGGTLNHLSHSRTATSAAQDRRTIMEGAVPVGQGLTGMDAKTYMNISQLTVQFHFRSQSRGIQRATVAVTCSLHGQATTTWLKKLFNKKLHFRNSMTHSGNSVKELWSHIIQGQGWSTINEKLRLPSR